MRLFLNIIGSLGTAAAFFYFMVEYWNTNREIYLVLVGFFGALYLVVRGYFHLTGKK